MSSIPYFSIAMRSGPIPKAKPVYFFESNPAISRTFGWTMPAPNTSIQPVCLHTRQPLPRQILQEMSISTEGSVNGKKLGRKRISRSAPKIFSRILQASLSNPHCDILIDDKAFNLHELMGVCGIVIVAPIHFSRTDDFNRPFSFMLLHCSGLNRRCMRTH